jgi:hypothetical protein
MDTPAIIQVASPGREAVRAAGGQVLGYLERQSLTGKILARDARGIVVGVYDKRSDLTRDAAGRILTKGNVLTALILRAR